MLHLKKINFVERYLRPRKSLILIAIFIFAFFFRLICFLQLNESPFLSFQNWNQCDMYYFDKLAVKIINGDLLLDAPLHPGEVHWKGPIADQYFKDFPSQAKYYKQKALSYDNVYSPAYLLWADWLGGKRFNQEPLYIYLIAAIYYFFSSKPIWVIIFQFMIGVLTIFLIFQVTHTYFGYLAALLASLLALFCAPLLFYEMF